jgi:hypothetical protein
MEQRDVQTFWLGTAELKATDWQVEVDNLESQDMPLHCIYMSHVYILSYLNWTE